MTVGPHIFLSFDPYLTATFICVCFYLIEFDFKVLHNNLVGNAARNSVIFPCCCLHLTSASSASQLCEDLFEKINEDSNKEDLSYSVEVSRFFLFFVSA